MVEGDIQKPRPGVQTLKRAYKDILENLIIENNNAKAFENFVLFSDIEDGKKLLIPVKDAQVNTVI